MGPGHPAVHHHLQGEPVSTASTRSWTATCACRTPSATSSIDLIRCMLDRDVEKRLDIEQVLAHKWCQGE